MTLAMMVTRDEIRAAAAAWPGIDGRAAESCAWLQACGYPGIRLLLEAAADEQRSLDIVPDAMGLDLRNVSCVYIAPAVVAATAAAGRYFLRNVRHGLYLVPLTVDAGMAIGCPIDLNFGMGGQRRSNPYPELLEQSEAEGIDIEDALWQELQHHKGAA